MVSTPRGLPGSLCLALKRSEDLDAASICGAPRPEHDPQVLAVTASLHEYYAVLLTDS